jgi:hypothetical protein
LQKRRNAIDAFFETSFDEDEEGEVPGLEYSARKGDLAAKASNKKLSRKRKRRRTEESEDLQKLMRSLEHQDVEPGVVKQVQPPAYHNLEISPHFSKL